MLTSEQKKQFLNSLENRKRELANVQSKIVNLRLLEKNIIKKIKKTQQEMKRLLAPKSEESTWNSSIRGILLTEDFPSLILESWGFSPFLLEEPRELSSEDLM